MDITHYTAFYRLNKQRVYVPLKPKKGGIIQSTELPEFQFRIKDLSERPSPEQMIDDPVYQSFVLPGYSEAKQQAETEKKARQQAEQRAQLLADKLRSLGINPDDFVKKE